MNRREVNERVNNLVDDDAPQEEFDQITSRSSQRKDKRKKNLAK